MPPLCQVTKGSPPKSGRHPVERYTGDLIMTREGDNKNIMVLSNEVFAKVGTVEEEEPQDKEVHCSWVDPHQLKEVGWHWC